MLLCCWQVEWITLRVVHWSPCLNTACRCVAATSSVQLSTSPVSHTSTTSSTVSNRRSVSVIVTFRHRRNSELRIAWAWVLLWQWFGPLSSWSQVDTMQSNTISNNAHHWYLLNDLLTTCSQSTTTAELNKMCGKLCGAHTVRGAYNVGHWASVPPDTQNMPINVPLCRQ